MGEKTDHTAREEIRSAFRSQQGKNQTDRSDCNRKALKQMQQKLRLIEG